MKLILIVTFWVLLSGVLFFIGYNLMNSSATLGPESKDGKVTGIDAGDKKHIETRLSSK